MSFYRTRSSLPDLDNLPDGSRYAFTINALTAADITTFLSNALIDPRVAAERFPFDRPRLRSER